MSKKHKDDPIDIEYTMDGDHAKPTGVVHRASKRKVRKSTEHEVFKTIRHALKELIDVGVPETRKYLEGVDRDARKERKGRKAIPAGTSGWDQPLR